MLPYVRLYSERWSGGQYIRTLFVLPEDGGEVLYTMEREACSWVCPLQTDLVNSRRDPAVSEALALIFFTDMDAGFS